MTINDAESALNHRTIPREKIIQKEINEASTVKEKVSPDKANQRIIRRSIEAHNEFKDIEDSFNYLDIEER